MKWFFVYVFFAIIAVATICGCRDESTDEVWPSDSRDDVPSEPACPSSFQYPLAPTSYRAGFRTSASFLNPSTHLGEDIRIRAGTSVKSIADGTIAWYGGSRGYGTLAVAIEHKLNNSITVKNGAGALITTDHLLSIYGYLRKNETTTSIPLAWRVGNEVNEGDVIGYINDDASNGVGREHVHFGIRLESAVDAKRHDPDGWFRAYDRNGLFRAYFAPPSSALAQLTKICLPTDDLLQPSPDAGE